MRIRSRTLQESVDYRKQLSERVKVSLERIGDLYRIEVIEPYAPSLGYWTLGSTVDNAKERLSDKLARTFGFIGRLVVQ
jgi:hypothetical protein